MKTQLIMLPNQPILITDEQVNGVRAYNPESKQVEIFCSHPKYDEWGLKIIAGISDKPKIDFSALSEEDCKKIGWVDIQKLGYDRAVERRWHPNSMETRRVANEIIEAVKYGFETAQSLNEKKFSEEDARLIWKAGQEYWKTSGESITFEELIERRNQLLSQPKVFDVEIQLDRTRYPKEDDGWEDVYTPRITDNKIKILKVL